MPPAVRQPPAVGQTLLRSLRVVILSEAKSKDLLLLSSNTGKEKTRRFKLEG